MQNFYSKYKTYFFFSILIFVEFIWILNSNGFYFIDDSSHFNFSRHLFFSYKESIGLWHRLGRVWLFALPAQFGLKGIQFFSALLFFLTIYFAYKILKLKKVKYAEWIVLLIGFQPVLFNISFTALAELPTAFLIVLSYYLYLHNEDKFVMIVSSFIFLFRMEYFFVSLIFLIIYLYRKKYLSLLLFFSGPLIWFFADWIIRGQYWRFHYEFMYYSGLPKINPGIDWYYYFFYSPVIFGVVQCIFFFAALCYSLVPHFFHLSKNSRKSIHSINLHQFIYSVFSFPGILFLFAALGLITQTLFASKLLSFSSSIGQLRYLAVVGPIIGLIAVLGLSRLYEFIKNKYIRLSIMVFFILVLFIQGPYTVPFHKKLEIEKVSEQITALAANSYPGFTILTNLQIFANVLDEPATGAVKYNPLTLPRLNGTGKALVIWARELEKSPYVKENVTLEQIEKSPGTKLIGTFSGIVNHKYDIPVCIFRDENSKFSRKLFDYLTFNQSFWENFEIRVYEKNPQVSSSLLK